MIEIKRKVGGVTKIFANHLEETAIDQIDNLGDLPEYKGSIIRIMPDAHAGAGCTVGTTMTIKDRVSPNLVGVDIGCGMLTVKLDCLSADDMTDDYLNHIDESIRKVVPLGFNIHQDERLRKWWFDKLVCKESINVDRAVRSMGTLGGGNHFIEIGASKLTGDIYLVIHSGSRNFGKTVCDHYNRIAKLSGKNYVEGDDFDNYINDMSMAQNYAWLNRECISVNILCELFINSSYSFHTVHNYIDTKSMILRKGAVSAGLNETFLVPMNMRDGSLVCVGKGNPDWNFSAPHGAGRLMSRKTAKESVSLDEFRDSMSGIFSTSISESTLDESPMAYKPMDDIIDAIGDTAEIVDVIKPIYNLKA